MAHDFLWRIRKAVPAPGQIGVFNRSHYEDVLVVRVHDLVPKRTWQARYKKINDFERSLVDDGVTMVKIMLHISYAEQGERLRQRLLDPTKYWKYNPADVDERAYWDDYQAAYADALDALLDRGRALVRRAGQPEVVPRLGGRHHPRGDARRSRAALSAAGLRSGRGTGTAGVGGVAGMAANSAPPLLPANIPPTSLP